MVAETRRTRVCAARRCALLCPHMMAPRASRQIGGWGYKKQEDKINQDYFYIIKILDRFRSSVFLCTTH